MYISEYAGCGTLRQRYCSLFDVALDGLGGGYIIAVPSGMHRLQVVGLVCGHTGYCLGFLGCFSVRPFVGYTSIAYV